MVAHLECNEVDLGFALAAEALIDAHRDDDPVRPLVLGPRHRPGGRSYAPSERGPHSGPVPKASALRGKRRNRTLREEPLTLCENIEHDYAESERKPEYDVAQQGSRAPSIATEHASAEIDDERREERHIAERRGVEPGDHAQLVQDQEHGPDREDDEGNPSRHV